MIAPTPPRSARRRRGRERAVFPLRRLASDELLAWTQVVERGYETEAVARYRETLKTRKTVIDGLEFAAKINKEIGLGSGEVPASGVTIIFESNIRSRVPRSKSQDGTLI